MAVTLAQVEQETAARCGPFEQHAAIAPSTATTVTVAALRSTIPLGGQTDRWLLRRAATVAADDRQRRVAAYDPATGTLTVDRPYAVPVAVGEPVEVMVLDPAQELRPAVLRGLARCYFVERAAVEVTPGQVAEHLSVALFWVTDLGQVRDVQSRVGTAHAAPLTWYRLRTSGLVGVSVDTCPPGTGVYVVEALRPHATFVNKADAPSGPQTDADQLDCALDYAAALGHAEAWRRCRATLGPIARAGYADPLEAVAREVNRIVRSQWWYWDRPDRVRVEDPCAGGQVMQSWHVVDDLYTWEGLSRETWTQVLEGIV